ncbi:hypothetical protein P12x_006000 (plasmid) [Tundrisphaera lichenicola]|uniref:hypothetical protein n=1 Tax=Tundrisphaera lichenicola TaxID=2029860 RepID=UPI003EBC1DD2
MIPPRTMRDLTSSLVGSSFRRVYRDGRVVFARRIRTLGSLPIPARDSRRS